MLRRIYTLIIALVILLIGCGATPAQHDKLGLTAEEKVFIINHPIVTIGVDPGFIPFSLLMRMANTLVSLQIISN